MADLVKCPFCNKDIEQDSFYCDQCGEELKLCSNGHGFKKGKICGTCGKPLTSAKDVKGDSTVKPTATVSATAAPNPSSDRTVRPAEPANSSKYLVSKTLGARLEMKNGAIIGRRAGDYVSTFASQGYVSGTHARLQLNGSGNWEVVDLDSSNGTFVNGQKLVPHQATILQVGDKVAFYDTEFIVEA